MTGRDNAHVGHRARMKEKLLSFGDRIFNTYELLEMLLYYAIPYKDTNPIAKALLKRFSSLDGVLSARRDELLAVDGIGPKAAELICEVGRVNLFERENGYAQKISAQEYFTRLLKEERSCSVFLSLLDNKLNLIKTVRICDTDYSSGGVRSEPFIEQALKSGASSVIIAHNHPHGAPVASEGDLATNAMIVRDLAAAGVSVIEHFIISGERCRGFMRREPDLEKSGAPIFFERYENLCADVGALLEKYCARRRGEVNSFVEIYDTKAKLVLISENDISTYFNGDMSTFVFIKLLFSLNSRRICDLFKFGKSYSEEALKRYLSALFLPLSTECLYLLSFDGAGRIISSDFISEGSVNALGIVPRRLLDAAVKRGARAVIIAHNHPSGYSVPSEDDREATARIREVFSSVGIDLINHYVVSSGGAAAIT